MSIFKQLIDESFDILLNTNEFAEIHVINDKEIAAVIESGTEENDNTGNRRFGRGTYTTRKHLYCKATDYGPLPKAGPSNVITIDGSKYSVLSADNEFGMYSILLEAVSNG